MTDVGRDWHATGYVASLAVGPVGLVVPAAEGSTSPAGVVGGLVSMCSCPSTGVLSTLIGVLFLAIAGSILADLWLDEFMARSRRAAAFLGTSTLLVGVVSLLYRPFG